MKKSVISFLILSGLLLATFAAADTVQIPNPLAGSDNLCELLTNIGKKVGELIAALGTIMIIWAGILFLTSAGIPEKINKAKAAVTWAIIGIVIGVSATVIIDIIQEVLSAAGSSCGGIIMTSPGRP